MIKKMLLILSGIFLLVASSFIEARDSTQGIFPTTQPGGVIVLKSGRTPDNFYANSELPGGNVTFNTGLGTTRCPPPTQPVLTVSPRNSGGYLPADGTSIASHSFTAILIACTLNPSTYNFTCSDARVRGIASDKTTALALSWTIYCI